MGRFLYSMFRDSVAVLPRNWVFCKEWNLPRKLLAESFDFQFLFLGTESYFIKLVCPDTRNKSKLFREMEILVPWDAPGTIYLVLYGMCFRMFVEQREAVKKMRLGFKRCSGVCLTNDDIRTHTLQPNEIAKKIYTKRESANPTKVELYPPGMMLTNIW